MVASLTLEASMNAVNSLRKLLRCVATLISLLGLAFFSSQTSAATRAVLVAGLGGNLEYNQAFEEQSRVVFDALQTITTSTHHVTYLHGTKASRRSVVEAISSIVQEANELKDTDNAIDTFILILMGHGNVNRDGWNFNLSGPDFTTPDLVGALASLNVPRQVIVASTSASGALLKPLAQPGRTVITATKSGGELNAVRFSEYFAEALANDAADVDRNELLTVDEAFIYANNLTTQYYEEKKLLASEHARFEGKDASSVTLATLGALRDAQNNPAVTALLEDRALLETRFYAVKARKTSLPRSEYYVELEAVLIDIANVQKRIDSLIGSGE